MRSALQKLVLWVPGAWRLHPGFLRATLVGPKRSARPHSAEPAAAGEAADTPFARSVTDAQRLLHYAMARGISVEDEVVRDIVTAQALLSARANDQTTFERQQSFWKALSRLSTATKPASIESLHYGETESVGFIARWRRAITGTQWDAVPTVADRAVRRAGWWALGALALVAVFQAYFEVGDGTVTAYNDAQRTVAEKRAAITTADKALAAASAARSASDAAAARAARSTAEVDVEQATDATDRRLRLMRRMMFWIDWDKQYGKDATPYTKAQITLSLLQGYLLVLREFVLPMLWGFLGAALYVSRALADDIRAASYTRERAIVFRSRYYMGMIAGFAEAKLFPTALGTHNGTITPFALALLVGYSVEVLFALLDKLIGAFTSKPS